MKNHALLATMFAGTLAASIAVPVRAKAATIDLVAPFGDFQIGDPALPAPPAGPKIYSSSGGTPQWIVQGWNLPEGRLSEFKRAKVGNETVATADAPSASAKITYLAKGSEITLSQNGAVLPCLTDKGAAREFDFFLNPVGTHVEPPAQTGLLHMGADNPKLSDMTHLMQQVTLTVQNGVSPTPKGCKTNFGNAIIGIVLSNTAVTPGQTMFYQLKLSRICGTSPTVQLSPCDPHPKPAPYFTKNPFGTDDFLPLVGSSFIASGETRTLNLDLLPRLSEILTTGPAAMDHNLAHWTVKSVYPGQHIWGDVTLRTTWKDFRLVAETR